MENIDYRGNGNRRATCILCGASTVEPFLALGLTALANKFVAKEELSFTEPSYPLIVGFCHTCQHVQLTERVPPKEMFEDYLYVSGASDTLKQHLYGLSDVVVQRFGLGQQDMVVDIGCNDGTLLCGFRRHGVNVLGVDPAVNLAAIHKDIGVDRHIGFFTAESSLEILAERGAAAAITATNTFPHIPQLQDFVSGIKNLLRPGGVFVIEAHYLVDLLEQRAFDTVYHEHVSYWGLRAMKRLFESAAMEIVDVERLPIHHGQIRVFVQRRGEGHVRPSVASLLEQEHRLGLHEFGTYKRFAEQTKKIKHDLGSKLHSLRRAGKKVAGYGAPAKGNTLLSYLEIGPDVLSYIADRSPLKQGRYTPGMRIPVVSPDRLLEDQPDYVLLLAWNFADEIIAQQAEYRARGGKFILPLPEVTVL